ncbi:hypothetical protein ACQ4PT_059187 [Festuca glaucescens]
MGTSVAATVAVAVTVVLVLAGVTQAQSRRTLIVSDARPLILFEQFGFARGGKAALSIRRSAWRLRPGSRLTGVDPTLMGFVLISGAQFPKINNASEYAAADPGGNSGGGGFCVLTSGYAVPMIRLSDVPAGGATSILPIDDPDEYAVVFNNCQEGVEVTMDVRTEMYNVRGGVPDGRRDRLPPRGAPAAADHLHRRVGGILRVPGGVGVGVPAEARDGGADPRGDGRAAAVQGARDGVRGGGHVEREKNVLMIVIPLQVIENLVLVVIGETGPTGRDWVVWNQLFLLVDVVCCCAVFFPIIWSIRALCEASKTDGKAARNLHNLTLFKRFYVVVVGYLYFTRIIASAFLALLSYRYQWGVNVAVEAASFAFYLFVFYNFHPVGKNPYLYVGDDEEESAGGQLEMDDRAF